MSSKRTFSSVLWAAYVVCLVGVSGYALYLHRDAVFWSLDGFLLRQLIDEQYRWFKSPSALGLDPLRGPGTLVFPVNFRLLPVFALQHLVVGHISRVLTYAGYAAEMILAGSLLARGCGLNVRNGALAGFVVTFLTMPLSWAQQTTLVVPIFVLEPSAFDPLLALAVFFVVYGQIGKRSVASSAACCVVSGFVLWWILAATPLSLVVLAPTIAGTIGAFLLLTTSTERLAKGVAALAIAAFLYLSGVLHFAYGVVGSTAANVFGFEIESYQFGRWWSSLVYQYDRFPIGSITAVVGILSALFAIRRDRGDETSTTMRAAAVLTSVCGIGLLVAWRVIELTPILQGQLRHVRLFYFELPLLPFYCLFAVVGLDRVLRTFAIAAPRKELLLNALVLLLLGGVYLDEVRKGRSTNPYPQPASPTAITAFLSREIGISSGSAFRGRVATVFSGHDSASGHASWDDQVAHDTSNYLKQGNDHRLVGLWAFGIPTLQEFSQALAPGTYFWITRTMSLADDKQDMRNHALISVPNVPLMKLLGVRYVISSQPLEGSDFVLRAQAGSVTDRLYELRDDEGGQHSARRVEVVRSIPEMLQQMHGAVSLMSTTWVFDDVPHNLAPGTVNINLVPSGIHVAARSEGTALMILPFTFSRCLSLTIDSGDPASRIVRANIDMLGLVFTRSVDATLTLETGAFHRSGCLIDEMGELRRLGLDQAVREFPRGSLVSPADVQ